jgi:outer membrane murein-binding lipoprotein Lpp
MARGVDSGWVRAGITAFLVLAGAAAGAATFHGRVVRNETRIDTLERDLDQLKAEVHDIWLKVVKNANRSAAGDTQARAR